MFLLSMKKHVEHLFFLALLLQGTMKVRGEKLLLKNKYITETEERKKEMSFETHLFYDCML